MRISGATDIDQLQTKIINFGESASKALVTIGDAIRENIVLIKSFAALLIAAFTINKIAAFIVSLEAIVKTVKTLRNALLAAAVARNFLFNPLGAAALTAGMFAAIGLLIKGVDAISEKAETATSNLQSMFATGGSMAGGDQGGAAKFAEGAAARAAKEAKAAALAQLKATKAQTKLIQDQNKLKKTQSLFDLEQIQIFAALQGKVSEEEKLRLSLQLALIQGNASEAERLGKQLAISQLQTTNLAQAIANIPEALNPFKGWGSEIDNLLAKLIAMYKLLNTPIQTSMVTPPTYQLLGNVDYTVPIGSGKPVYAEGITPTQLSYMDSSLQSGYSSGTTIVNNYNVSGATQGLLNELRSGLLNDSASGSFSTSNRAIAGD